MAGPAVPPTTALRYTLGVGDGEVYYDDRFATDVITQLYNVCYWKRRKRRRRRSRRRINTCVATPVTRECNKKA